MPNDVSEMAASHRRAFDAAAKIAREVVAKKDAEIAQALDDLARWESIARDSIKYGLEKDKQIKKLCDANFLAAEVVRLDAELKTRRELADVYNFHVFEHIEKHPECKEAFFPMRWTAQPRRVTDAQREAIREALRVWWSDADDILGESDKRLMNRIIAIIESTDEPAAEEEHPVKCLCDNCVRVAKYNGKTQLFYRDGSIIE
jgi:hypothetical protein